MLVFDDRMEVQEKYKYGVNILWWMYIKNLNWLRVYYGVYDRATSSIADIDFWWQEQHSHSSLSHHISFKVFSGMRGAVVRKENTLGCTFIALWWTGKLSRMFDYISLNACWDRHWLFVNLNSHKGNEGMNGSKNRHTWFAARWLYIRKLQQFVKQVDPNVLLI